VVALLRSAKACSVKWKAGKIMTPVNKIFLGIGAALVLIGTLTIIWLSLANAHLKTKLAQAQSYATACHMANDEFAAHVLRQNAAVQALRDDAAAHEKHAQFLSAEAEKTAQRYALAADKLRKAAPSDDACRAADALFNQYLESK
jgi:hypothetical protein